MIHEPSIECRNVSKTYSSWNKGKAKGVKAIQDLSLSISG